MIGSYRCLLIESFLKLTRREFSPGEKKTVNENFHAGAQAIDKQGRKTFKPVSGLHKIIATELQRHVNGSAWIMRNSQSVAL
jgi:hypothetical protein